MAAVSTGAPSEGSSALAHRVPVLDQQALTKNGGLTNGESGMWRQDNMTCTLSVVLPSGSRARDVKVLASHQRVPSNIYSV